MKGIYKTGDTFEGVLLETCLDSKTTRPRVRPLEYFDLDMRVEFPRALRDNNPIGSRFRADVKVSQKTKDGVPYGQMYLVANVQSIESIDDFQPINSLRPIRLDTVSGRAYSYTQEGYKSIETLVPFHDFRSEAYLLATAAPDTSVRLTISFQRSDTIKLYARSRAQGCCEGCGNEAPFLKRNGQPYLEVHHLSALSNGGSDSPENVIALCPNCHARVTHGLDGIEYNELLKSKIQCLEIDLGYNVNS